MPVVEDDEEEKNDGNGLPGNQKFGWCWFDVLAADNIISSNNDEFSIFDDDVNNIL